MKKKSWFFLILSILTTAFIFYNSLKPAGESLKSSGVISDFLYKTLSMIFENLNRDTIVTVTRKCAHIFEFFMQSTFLGLFYYFKKPSFLPHIQSVLFGGLLVACVDELLQKFVEGRGSLVSDIFIDFIGVILATLFVFIISGIFKERRKN